MKKSMIPLFISLRKSMYVFAPEASIEHLHFSRDLPVLFENQQNKKPDLGCPSPFAGTWWWSWENLCFLFQMILPRLFSRATLLHSWCSIQNMCLIFNPAGNWSCTSHICPLSGKKPANQPASQSVSQSGTYAQYSFDDKYWSCFLSSKD